MDRRALLRLAVLGAGALALPGGRALAESIAAARGFTHNVASGEPGARSTLVWTRFVGAGDAARVRAEIAETADFSRVVAGDEMITGPWRDWTVKIALAGLQPGRRYYYRFIGPEGQRSPVGRTLTLPEGAARSFTLGVFSCSNLPFGWFNAYGHAAADPSIDLAVHMGDYLYEYPRGTYPGEKEALRLEALQPTGELLALADYRLRYAAYRLDPDLAALHAAKPMIMMMDDHESANDSWEGGAQNHQIGEGEWAIRRAAALQAWYEWQPVADRPYGEYRIGSLASLYRTDTRLLARSEPADMAGLMGGQADPVEALRRFRAADWGHGARTMFGTEQERWLIEALSASVRSGTVWQVVGSGTNMGMAFTPLDALDWIGPDAPERVRSFTTMGIAAARAGLPFNLDAWSGYPAARARLLGAAQQAGASVIVVSGDSHNGWAFDLQNDGRPAGVEMGGHSVTSPGFEAYIGTTPPTRLERGFIAASPELKWADMSRRGYMRLDLTPEAAQGEWLFMDTIARRTPAVSARHRMTILPQRNRFEV